MNLQTIQRIAVIFVLAAIGALAFEGALLLRQIRKDEVQLVQQTSSTLTDVRRTVLIVGGTASNIEKETREWKDQSVKQVAAATKATQILDADLEKFGVVLTTVNTTVQDQSTSLASLEEQANVSLVNSSNQVDSLMRQLQPALTSLSTQLPETMQNIKDTSAQTVIIAKNTADTSLQIDGTVTDIHNYIHRETTPVRGTWHLLSGILEHFAAPAASVATALK